MNVSHSKYFRVPRLDLVSALFDAKRIVLKCFDFLERFAAELLLDQRVHGMGARKVDQQLLGFTGVQPVLEKARRVGIRRRLEQRARARDQGSTFGRIYDFYRLPLLLELDEIVLIAIGHHGALAESDLLRSIGRGLNLHHSLLGEFLEIPPAELAHNLERSRHDGAAVGGMRLNHLPRPLWVKQVREALGCLLRLYQCRVIAERGQPHACRNKKAVRVVIFLRIVARDLLRQIRNEPAVSLPHDAMGSVWLY